jgi:hypothetical protein
MVFAAKGFNTYHSKNLKGFDMPVDTRLHMLSRLFRDRSEWAVNAAEEVLLSLPHAVRERPSEVRIEDGAFSVAFEGGIHVPVPVPLVVAPFLARAATVLVVTLKDTGIASETDVHVRRGPVQAGVFEHA